MHVQREHPAQHSQRGSQPAGVDDVMSHLRSHGPVLHANQPGRDQPAAPTGWGPREIALSFTGRLTTAANTPSAIAMYQTMS